MAFVRIRNVQSQAAYLLLSNGLTAIVASHGSIVIDESLVSTHVNQLKDDGWITIGPDTGEPVTPPEPDNPLMPSTAADRLATAVPIGTVVFQQDDQSSWMLVKYPASVAGNWKSLAPVSAVNGKTGTVVLTKADVGLGNADNTSDLNKPISTATQTALDGKLGSLTTVVPVVIGADFTVPVTKEDISSGSLLYVTAGSSTSRLGLDAALPTGYSVRVKQVGSERIILDTASGWQFNYDGIVGPTGTAQQGATIEIVVTGALTADVTGFFG